MKKKFSQKINFRGGDLPIFFADHRCKQERKSLHEQLFIYISSLHYLIFISFFSFLYIGVCSDQFKLSISCRVKILAILIYNFLLTYLSA